MTKEQAEAKLAVLPLLTPVTVEYADIDGEPHLSFSYATIPGPGNNIISVDLDPSEAQLNDLVNNFPLAAENRLAALAIMIAAPL